MSARRVVSAVASLVTVCALVFTSVRVTGSARSATFNADERDEREEDADTDAPETAIKIELKSEAIRVGHKTHLHRPSSWSPFHFIDLAAHGLPFAARSSTLPSRTTLDTTRLLI